MNIALPTFAAWPKAVYGRVSFTALCACGRDAAWEQIAQPGVDGYEISCSCAGTVAPSGSEPAPGTTPEPESEPEPGVSPETGQPVVDAA